MGEDYMNKELTYGVNHNIGFDNIFFAIMFFIENKSGDVSLPLSTGALGHAVGVWALDASRRGCGVRMG